MHLCVCHLALGKWSLGLDYKALLGPKVQSVTGTPSLPTSGGPSSHGASTAAICSSFYSIFSAMSVQKVPLNSFRSPRMKSSWF